MTGVQTCALPICFPVTIPGGIDENGEIRTDARGAIQIDINKLVNRFQEIISDDVDAITIRKVLEIKEDGNIFICRVCYHYNVERFV